MTDPEKASLNVAKQRPHPQDARKSSFHNWAAATGAGAQTLYESSSVASKAITGKGDNECDPAETQFVFVAADSALAMSEPRAAKAQAEINAELAQLKKLCPDAAACPAAFWTSARVTDMLSCLAFPPHTGPASGPQWRAEPDAPQHTISAEKTGELFHRLIMAETPSRSKPGSVPQISAVVPDLSEGTGASQAPSDKEGVSGFPVGTKVVLYKGRYMQLFRMLVRFKIFQLVGIAALAVPINTFLVEVRGVLQIVIYEFRLCDALCLLHPVCATYCLAHSSMYYDTMVAHTLPFQPKVEAFLAPCKSVFHRSGWSCRAAYPAFRW